MPFLTFIQSNTFIVIVGAAAIVYTNWKLRAGAVSTEVIGNYEVLEKQLRTQKAELEKKLADQASAHSKEMNEIHQTIGQKNAIIKMQEGIIKDQKETIANRNPDLEGLLRDIKRFMELLHAAAVANNLISAHNSAELDNQTRMMGGEPVVRTSP